MNIIWMNIHPESPTGKYRKGRQRNPNAMVRNRLIIASFLALLATGSITSCQNSLQLSRNNPSSSDTTFAEEQRSGALADRTSVTCTPKCFLATTGIASYYADRFHGRTTANGETFDMNDLTAAHKSLPFGTWVRVTNTENGREVTVRINDRGPYVGERIIDLSREAAKVIGLIQPGTGEVKLEAFETNPDTSISG